MKILGSLSLWIVCSIFYWPTQASAAVSASIGPNSSQDGSLIGLNEQEAKLRIEDAEKQLELLKSSVLQKARLLHYLQNGTGGTNYVWEPEENQNLALKREKLGVLARVQVRELIKRLESLEERREELGYEFELLKLKNNEMSEIKSQTSAQNSKNAAANFSCQVLPVIADTQESKISLAQDFGTHKDVQSGLEWRSSGWWLSHIDHSVKACAPGKIVFIGKVSGRGTVLLIDHGNGNITLYANLNDEVAATWSKGMKVTSGTVLGSSKEKFYFEVRSQGTAIDPRQVFSESKLTQLAL